MTAAVLVFAACAAACVVGHVAILRSVVRKGASHEHASVPRPRFLVELVWAAIPIVVLAVVLTATWARVRNATGHEHTPDMIMEVAR